MNEFIRKIALTFEEATSETALQESCRGAVFIFERHRGLDPDPLIAPEAANALALAEEVDYLAQAIATFIASHEAHADLGSAVWALGKAVKAEYQPLLQAVRERAPADSWLHRQASIALEDLESEVQARLP